MISEREPNFPTNNSRFWDPFLDAFWSLDAIFLVLIFACFLVPSQNDFLMILEPREPPKGRLSEINLETFSENAKTLIFETPHKV